MDDSSWAVVIAAGLGLVGVVVTVLMQTLVNRGEPAKLRTLRFLNEALEKYDADDVGRSNLRTARQTLATELAASLTSPTFRQAFQAQTTNYSLSGVDALASGGWIIFVILYTPTFKKATEFDWPAVISLAFGGLAAALVLSAVIKAGLQTRH